MADYEVRLLDFDGELLQVIETVTASDAQALTQAAALGRAFLTGNYLVRRCEESEWPREKNSWPAPATVQTGMLF